MIKKRKAQGCITQAQVIFETNSTVLVRDNIVPSKDEEGKEIEGQVSYDEYIINKHDFPTLRRLALANLPAVEEHEERVFEILRNEFENTNDSD